MAPIEGEGELRLNGCFAMTRGELAREAIRLEAASRREH